MRMGLGLGAVALLIGAVPSDAHAKPEKDGKIRAEATLGEDGVPLGDYIQWRAVPVLDEPPVDGNDAPRPLGGGRLDAELPPGRYVVEAEVAPIVKAQEVEIRSGKRTRLEIVFEGAFIEFSPKNVEGEFECGGSNGREDRSFTASEPTLRLFEPGVWDVSCRRGEMSVGRSLELRSGQTLRLAPDLSVGTLTSTVVNDADYPDDVYFEVREYDARAGKAGSAVFVSTGASLSAELPPGSYEVLGRMAFDRPVADFIALDGTTVTTVEVDQTAAAELDIPWALIKPELQLVGRRARAPKEPRWYVFPAEDRPDKPYAIRLQAPGTPFTLHAYDVPIVIEVHDEFDAVVATSAPFVPVRHAVTDVPIRIR